MDYQRNDRFRPTCTTCRNVRQGQAATPQATRTGKTPYSASMNTVHDPSMIAMVFSPKQSFHKLYEPEKALCRGTLFEELDKPFHPHCSR